jgi:hypothetical protein
VAAIPMADRMAVAMADPAGMAAVAAAVTKLPG